MTDATVLEFAGAEDWPCPWCSATARTVSRLCDHATLEHATELAALQDDHWAKPRGGRRG
jgi:hypothetical protein